MFEGDDKLKRRFSAMSIIGSVLIIFSTVIIAALLDIKTAGTYIFMFVTLSSIWFCVLYSKSHWRRTPPGRAVMYVVGSFACVGLVICVNIIFGNWPGRNQLRLATFMGVALAMYNVALTLWHFRLLGRKALKEHCDTLHENGICIHRMIDDGENLG